MKTRMELAALCGVEVVEIDLWVERRWLRPIAAAGAARFDEVDEARARLIAELNHELAVNDEALPVVLSLVDQVHALRGQVRRLVAAVAALPEAERTAILRELAGGGDKA